MLVREVNCSAKHHDEVMSVKEQGRRRVFKSGPAEEIIECRRQERKRAREGDSRQGGRGARGIPRENFEFLAFLCAFLMVFYAFETGFSRDFLLEKIFLGA